MANFANLKAAINAVIKANGQREITGDIMNQVLTAMVNSLGSNFQFAGVATPSTNPGTPDQNVFYMATQAGTYTNFSAIVLQAGISILLWNGSWTSETFFTVDAVPTSGSNNFITSGAVFDKMKLDGGAYDVTAHNNNATFADLSALLNSENINTLIPVAVRHGGMSIKFVQSSDNKYVQYMCKTSTWSSTPTDWEKVNNVSVSQNTNTKHTDINISGVANSVASVKEVNELEIQVIGKQYIETITATGEHLTDISVIAGVEYTFKNIGEIGYNAFVAGDTSVVCRNLAPNSSATFTPASDGFITLYSGSVSSGTMGILITGAVKKTINTLVADVLQLSNKVDNLEDNLEATDTKLDALTQIEHSVNLLNPSTVQVGFWKNDNGVIALDTSNQNYRCAFVDVISGDDYIVTGLNNYAFTADSNGNVAGYAKTGTSDVSDYVLDTDDNSINPNVTITRVYLNWNKNYHPTEQQMVAKGTTLPPTYVPYSEKKYLTSSIYIHKSQIDGINDEEIYVVAPSGGDYTTLTQALTDLNGNSNKKTIIIKDGSYDVWNEIGGKTYADTITEDDYNNNRWKEKSVMVPPNTKIIGEGNVILNFYPTPQQTNQYAAALLSCINVDNDVEIENITIICGNCRYGIHDETGGTTNKATHIYKNVRVFKQEITYGKSQAIGIGFVAHQIFKFDNCHFEASYHPMTFHNAGTSGEKDGTIITINNTIIKALNATDQSLQLGNVNGTQVEVLVNLASCYIKNGIKLYNASSTERPNAYNLSILHCNELTVTCEPITNIYTPQIYN